MTNIIDPFDSVANQGGIIDPFDDPNFKEVKPQPKSGLIRRAVGDNSLALLKSAIGVPETAVGLADLVTGGQAGKLAEQAGFRPKEAKAMISDYFSPELKLANEKVQQADGFVDTAITALQYPSSILNSAVESSATMLGGGVIAGGVRKALPIIAPFVAGAIGEGAVTAGQNAEQLRQETADGLLTGEQSALTAGSGAITGLIGAVSGGLSKKLGIADIDTMLAQRALGTKLTGKALAKGVAGGILTEGMFEEAPQSAQEQIAQNLALGKPWDEGVGNAAAMGGLTGGLMGGGANLISGWAGRNNPPPVITAPPAVQTPPPAPPAAPAGTLTSAANIAQATGATAPVNNPHELSDLVISENRDAEFRRAQMQVNQQKQREMNAIEQAHEADRGILPDQQVAAANVATDETPTNMVEAFARAKALKDQQTAIDQAAHEAATSPNNNLAQPTEAQQTAGNYKKGHVQFNGLNISVENPAGSTRSGVDENGVPWENTLNHHYGYIKRTMGNDGDNVDVFMGNKPDSGKVFVVNQTKADGSFDEHKAVLGADSAEEAAAIYQSNYAKDWQGGKSITELSMPAFKDWLKNGDATKPLETVHANPNADVNNLAEGETVDVGGIPYRKTANGFERVADTSTAQAKPQQQVADTSIATDNVANNVDNVDTSNLSVDETAKNIQPPPTTTTQGEQNANQVQGQETATQEVTKPDDGMVSGGEQLKTISGRIITVPPLKLENSKQTAATIKRLNEWQHAEAVKENAGNDWNLTLLKAINPSKMSQSDQDTVTSLLYGDTQVGANNRMAKPAPVSPTNPTSDNRIYLDVPFTSVKFAKDRGAKWDAEKKLWYATPLAEGAQKGQIADGLSIPLFNPSPDQPTFSKNSAKVVALNKTKATGIEHIVEQSTAHPAEWIVKPVSQAETAQTTPAAPVLAPVSPIKPAEPTTVLQNRDRSQPESIKQMRAIAANPDASRLSFSRDAANGAPVVTGQLPANAALGKLDHAVTANNRKLAMQYAVVEADSVIPSHDVNGNPNANYSKGEAGKMQVIGGNGRVAGLQEAYRNNNGENYAQGIAKDSDLHGVSAEAIKGMKHPVLIRVMNQADVTPTIGDELNGRTNMGLSVLEQAKTDAARLKLETLDFAENGAVTQDAIKAFVQAMPENERNELMDGGRVGRKAEERLMAAIFHQAYGDDELVRIFAQAQDVESKAVMTALANAAPAMARLTEAGNLDIRSIVADAAKVAVNSTREGVSLTKLAAQGDMELGEDVMAIVRFMAQNIRKPKAIAEALTEAAQYAYGIANEKTVDMYGGEKVSRADVIRRVANDYQGRQENLVEQGGGQTDGSDVGGETNVPDGRSDNQATESTGQPASQAEQVTNNQYTAPISIEDATNRWKGKFNGTEYAKPELGINQKTLMQAVEKALDKGLFYNKEVVAFVAKELNVTDAQLAVGINEVENGAFGYDVYLARQEVQKERLVKANVEQAKALKLSIGENIGKVKLTDGKIASASTVTKIDEDTVTLTGKRGTQTISFTTDYVSLVEYAKRAENNYLENKVKLYADLLGDNTTTKQALADAERAKDAKRNTGTDNQAGFTLTGSNSEADIAAAAGAQDLFAPQAIKPKTIQQLRADFDAAQAEMDNYKGAERTDKRNILDVMHEASAALTEANSKLIQVKLDAGEMPVITKGGLTFALHPATDGKNNWQVTRYNERGAFGDTRYETVAQAIKDNDLGVGNVLDKAEATKLMEDLSKKEMAYQESKSTHTESPKLSVQQTTAPTNLGAKVTPQVLSPASAENYIKIAADSVKTLRQQDVERVLDETPAIYKGSLASYIKINRTDLVDEVNSVMQAKPTETAKPATDLLGKKVNNQNIQDLGEKIGGARKDTAVSTGTKAKRTDSNPEAPTWAKRYRISEIAHSMDEKENGTWVINDLRQKNRFGHPREIGKGFASKEIAEAELPALVVGLKHRVYGTATLADGKDGFEIWRNVTERKRVKIVDKVFASRIEALTYMGEHAKEILETNTTFGEMDLPTPDDTNRVGKVRHEADVASDDFMNTFGFRGVEFGEWNNQIERQQVMNAAYDGLLDLTEVLNLPPKALTLNGDLALAFGARGQGLSSAKAHYERHKAVINLTKMNGAGSLAHEWFHALDHYFARQGGQSPSTWQVDSDGTRSLKENKYPTNDFISSGISSLTQLRPEIQQAYKALMQTMTKKATTYVEDTVKSDDFVAKAKDELAQRLDNLRADLSAQRNAVYGKRHNAPASAEQLVEFDTIAKQLLDGQGLNAEYKPSTAPVTRRGIIKGRNTNDALEKLSAIYKAVRGRSGFDSTNQHGIMDRLRGYMTLYSTRLKMLADAQKGEEKIRYVPTDFAMNARQLDEGRASDYWTTPHEMAARAFQGYVEDKVAESGGKSPFLNYGRENAGILTPWGVQYPFPRGEERKAINAAFDKFIGAFKTKQADTGSVTLYSRGNTERNDLIAQHNLSADNLLHAIKMGGIPVPSLAIVNKDATLDSFGEITLLADRDLIDPKGRRKAKVFGSDIYSPRYPSITYKYADGVIDNLQNDFAEAMDATGQREFDADKLEDNPHDALRGSATRYQFLKDNGIEPKVVYQQVDKAQQRLLDSQHLKPFISDKIDAYQLSYDQAFIDAYMAELKAQYAELNDAELSGMVKSWGVEAQRNLARDGAYKLREAVNAGNGKVDTYATQNSLDSQFTKALSDKYQTYIDDLVKSLNADEKLYAGRTNQGRKKFIPHTLDNVIKALKKDLRGGENWNYGLGSTRAKYAPQFKSITEIKQNKARLLDADAFEAVKNEMDDDLSDLQETLRRSHPAFANEDRFGFGDTVTGMLSDAATMGIPRALKESGFEDVSSEATQEIAGFMTKLRNMPTEYFETLILGSVDIAEFAGAVVPNDTRKEVLDALKSKGITNIKFYDPNVPKSRGETIQKFNNLMFSRPAAPTFYSALSRAIPQAKQDTMPATQWANWLTANAGKLNIKQAELQWSGLTDWLKLQQGKVSKADIQTYLASNGVQVTETILGTSELKPFTYEQDADGWNVLDHNQSAFPNGRIVDGAFENEWEARNRTESLNDDLQDGEYEGSTVTDSIGAPKYESYTVEGGKNYKELLLTLPERKQAGSDYTKLVNDIDVLLKKQSTKGLNDTETSELHKKLQLQNSSKYKASFQSAHFNEDNILAHVRFDERTDAEGNKVLFIHELQSDWGQIGRKHGFKVTEAELQAIKGYDLAVKAEQLNKDWREDRTSKEFQDEGWAYIKAEQKAQGITNKDLQQAMKAIENYKLSTVPKAPFVTDTKAWVALAIKRMARYAAENGFDKVAFVNGQQSADFYDLSKQVDSVRVINEGGGLYGVMGLKDGNTIIVQKQGIKSDNLSDIIGKDLAEKAINDNELKNKNDGKTYSGIDLKIGGEGMRGFYDNIVPQVANDVLKKLGGGKVETLNISTKIGINGNDTFTYSVLWDADTDTSYIIDNATGKKIEGLKFTGKNNFNESHDWLYQHEPKLQTKQLGFTITPEMRESVMEGQPLFSRPQSKFNDAASNGESINLRDLNAVVEHVSQTFKGLPQTNVLEDYTQAPAELRDDIERDQAHSAAGAWHNGEIYLFRNNIVNAHHAMFTVLHEATHEGLRRTFGKDIDATLMAIYLGNSEIRDQANDIRTMHSDLSLVAAVEETLADMGGHGIKASVMDKLVAFVRGALRKLGVDMQFTDGEVRALVNRALNSVKKSGTVVHIVGGSAYSDKLLMTQPLSQKFKKWFGDSKIVDAEGKPMVVYHGTNKSFDTFNPRAEGRTQGGEKLNGVGAMFFTNNAELAGQYAGVAKSVLTGDYWAYPRESSDGGNIMPSYLSMKNPLIVDANAQIYSNVEPQIIQAKKDGYDGVILKNVVDQSGAAGSLQAIQHDAYIVFDPNQIKSAIGNNGNFDANNNDTRFSRHYQANPAQEQALRNVGAIVDHKPIKQWVAEKTTEWTSNLAQKIADQFEPLKRLDMHAYILARMSKSYDGAMEALINFGNIYIDKEGANNTDVTKGTSFIKSLQRLQGEQERFFWWIAANRAEQLSAESRENLFSDTDISALKTLNTGALADGQDRTTVYQDVLKEYTKVGKSVLDAAEASGIIDGDSRKIWEHEMYVPFYRALEDGISSPNIGSKQGLVRQYAFKQLKGGKAKIHHDLMANIMLNWTHLIAASGRNRAAEAGLKAAEAAGIATPIHEAVKGSVFYLGKFIRQIPKGQTYTENGIDKISDGTAEIEQHGQVHYLVDDPAVLDAMTSLEYAGLGGGSMRVLSAFKRALTYGVTFNPAFKIRNLIRDTLAALAINPISANPLQNISQGVGIMRHKDSQAYASLLAGGGIIRFGSMLEGNNSIHMSRLINAGIDKNNIIDTKEKMMDMLTKATDWYAELGDISEGINRAALYQQLRDQGVSHLDASYQARDMLDFTMGGTNGAIRFLVQTVPFMNARIQGLYKLGRAGKADPKRMANIVGVMALASIALMLAFKDDDDWKKREDWDRDNYWWFKIGDTAYRIPKPFEVGMMATLAERSLEYLTDDEMTNQRMWERIQFAVGQTLAFNPVPQMFKPAIDVYSNVNSFTGRPIEPMGMERLQKQDRVSRTTSELARGLGTVGQYANLSPVQIDHLVRGYFGWLAIAANTVVDGLASTVIDRPEMPSRILKDTFLVGNFAEGLPSNQSRYLTQFYNQAKEIEQAQASWRNRLKEGDVAGAQAFRADNAEVLKQFHRVQNTKRLLTTINARINQVYNSGLDPETKRDKLGVLNQRKAQLAEQVARYLK